MSSVPANIFRGADCEAVLALTAHESAQGLFEGEPVEALRDDITLSCVKLLKAYRTHCAAKSSSGQLILPETLKHLPVYTLSLMRSDALSNEVVDADARAAFAAGMLSVPASLAGVSCAAAPARVRRHSSFTHSGGLVP